MHIQLQVYYDSNCSTARFTQELIHSVRNHYLGLSIKVVDLNIPEIQIPENVFAVPSFLINGSTVFLGNPTQQELIEHLKTYSIEADLAGYPTKAIKDYEHREATFSYED